LSSTTAPNAEFVGAGKIGASPVYIVDTNGVPKINAAQTTSISAGTTSDTVIKSSAGVFYGMLVTTSAAGTPTVYDNASGHTGTILSMAPASTIGSVATPAIGVQALNGITVQGSASNPGIVIYWN
jgi:hypothetical protein